MAETHASLKKQTFLYFDCQTTGMNPTSGNLLEIGWALGKGGAVESAQSRVLAQPEGCKIPRRIKEITGIAEHESIAGPTPAAAWEVLEASLPARCTWVIHYAKFELAFIRPLFEARRQPVPGVVCTYEVARRLLPNLGSHTIRAVCGHLGRPLSALKRASDHVEATAFVWGRLLEILGTEHGVKTSADFNAWYAKTPPPKNTRKRSRAYLIESEARLGLAESPGTYHLKDCEGRILYIGKATSLKSRVNSYFRGQQTKGSRLNEMLAQVADLKVYSASTPLEAALLENDQIKQWDPPYNRALKAESREVFYCGTDFSIKGTKENPRFGPFTTSAWWPHLIAKLEAVEKPEVLAALFSMESGEDVDARIVVEGLQRLQEEHGIAFGRAPEQIHYWLACGFIDRIKRIRTKRLEKERSRLEVTADEDAEEEVAEVELVWDPPRVARRLLRFMGSTALRVHSGRWARRFHDSRVWYREPSDSQWRALTFQNGALIKAESLAAYRKPQRKSRKVPSNLKPEMSIATLDRLRVLRTELLRVLARGGDAYFQSRGDAVLDAISLKRLVFPGQFDG